MRTIDDVATLTCVELSRAIMTRPDINTGSLFGTIGASRNEVNKSDSVLVITAAILETIGNAKAAKDILNKSRTVTEFYLAMNLNNEKLRTSFVIMLFALAPEFVKMTESALRSSLEQVQSMTSAPHAETKLFNASAELMREGIITDVEQIKMMRDFTKISIDPSLTIDSSSIQNTPKEMIGSDDSVSNVGNPYIAKSDSPLSTMGIMRYMKRNPTNMADNFYDVFPNAKRPVPPTSYRGRAGIGVSQNKSVVSDDISESNFTEIMNQMLNPATKTKRHSLSSKDKEVFNTISQTNGKLRNRSMSFVTADENRVESPTIVPEDNVVTMDDIRASDNVKSMRQDAASRVITNPEVNTDDSYLLDLL